MKVEKITVRIVEGLSEGESAWAGNLAGFHVKRGRRAATYYVTYRSHGVQKYLKLGSSQLITPAQAYDRARAALLRVSDGHSPADERDAERKAGDVAHLTARYLEAGSSGTIIRKGKVKKASTVATERSRAAHWITPFLGNRSVNFLQRSDVEKLMHRIASDSTPSNATSVITLLSSIYAWAEKNGLARSNPCKGIDKFEVAAKDRVLSEDEWKAFAGKLDGATHEWPHNVALVRFLIHTGMRRSEAIHLRFDSVNLKNRTVTLAYTKTGKSMRYLSKLAVSIVERQRKLIMGELVFPGPQGGPVAMSGPWPRLTVVKEITPHVLRHSYATIATELGMPESVVAALLGHSKGSVTAGYIHAGAKHLIEAADVVSSKIDVLMHGASNVVALDRAKGA
jgi:integrase